MNGVNDDATGEMVGHHSNHARLLAPPPLGIARDASVDAIVVPSVRPAAALDSAIDLATRLDCPLLVLCSKGAVAADVALRAEYVPHVIPVDIGMTRLPRFETTELLARTELARRTDTSLKRNLALALAAMVGWERLMFLDDDIEVKDAADVRTAAGLLDSFAAVGLRNNGFPDNSVVCHARRAVGDTQGSFIGGGALAVAAGPGASFFPTIYNEDWFFLLDDNRLHPVTATGTVTQAPFDPYLHPERARSEEFGDCMAEGIFAVLDNKGRIQDATRSYWKHFLDNRGRMILDIMERVPGSARTADGDRCTLEQKLLMVRSLRAAHRQLGRITPELCSLYLSSWQHDRKLWGNFLAKLSRGDADYTMRRLGVNASESALRALSSAMARGDRYPVVPGAPTSRPLVAGVAS